jgi:hypothetical protein
MTAGPHDKASVLITQQTPLLTFTPLLPVIQLLPSNGCFSGSTILALSKYGIIVLQRYQYLDYIASDEH